MRTKIDGWKRKGQLRASVRKHGTHVVFVVGVVLLIGATMVLMPLGNGPSHPGDDHGISAHFPGTISSQEWFHCDRSHLRTDICNMRGDIRMESHHKAKSFVLYTQDATSQVRKETLKPYTRKWEAEGSMRTVNELTLASHPTTTRRPRCDVYHKVPGVVFSTGGYTGNLYHEFNDGLIPLFITSQHLHGEVVLLISSFHDWWYSKYQDLVGKLSSYEIIDMDTDTRVHCFPEIEAGLHIHGELTINPNKMLRHESIHAFRALLNRAYKPGLGENRRSRAKFRHEKPRLTIIVRKKTRKFLNLHEIVKSAEQLGFNVSVLSPGPSTELKKIFEMLDDADVVMGVHGAAMTHFLFMRPGAVFIQVIPLGTDWAAEEYYGAPAVKLGLQYVPYKIEPSESSLSDKYNATDPVLVDPERITNQGWGSLKKIYLDGQDVRPNLGRMSAILAQAKQDLRNRATRNRLERE